MKNDCLVSVIIPVYNAEHTIQRSIESVVFSIERYKLDYEIICIDDGSSDSSMQKLKEIAANNKRIIVQHQDNSGAAAARNRGLEIAKGEYIAFNDSDDEWLPDHFSILQKAFNDNPELVCVAGNHETSVQKIPSLKSFVNNVYKIRLRDEIFKNYFSPQATMIKRICFDSGIRFKEGMRYAEEGFFFYRIAYQFPCGYINTPVSKSILKKARYGDGGLSGNLKAMEQGELFNIRYAYKELGIPFHWYLLAISFSYIKYIRRIIVVKFRKKRNA